jgi:hypothetical protein
MSLKFMSTQATSWLQLYVDAVMEKDPYKRLALVQQLRQMPRDDDADELLDETVSRSAKKSKILRRH